MKKLLAMLLILCTVCPLLFALSSCNAGDEVITLYVYNWGEYISDGSEGSYNTNKEFEKYMERVYGQKVEVNYSTYSSNEDMYAKLVSGAAVYDVVIPSDYMVARLIEEERLLKLNKQNIKGLENVDLSAIIDTEYPYYDPKGEYSVPYTYGTVGIIYNAEKVDEADLGGWDLMWNEKYSGNILQFNNSRDAFATAQFYLGYSINSDNEQEWRDALSKLLEQKSIVQGYVMDEIFNKMESGSAYIAPYYAGDFFTMYESNEDLWFYHPSGLSLSGKQEATNVFVDAMCVPTTSAHPEIAEKYIEFMLTEEAAVANAEYICYASPNKLVRQNEDYRAAMDEVCEEWETILYGTEDLTLEFYQNLPEEKLVLLNSLWEELKIESSIGVSIIVIACVIVAGLIALGVFLYVQKRKRRRYVSTLWDR